MARRTRSTTDTPQPTATARSAPATSTGPSVRVRMYNVGFGDCFLLELPGTSHARPVRRVLIDCGVHGAGRGPWKIREVAKAVIDHARDADGVPRIDLVVATHRHADHISGFEDPAWSEVVVSEVWLPWTEHPTDPEARRIRKAQTKLALALDAPGFDITTRTLATNALSNAGAMRTLHDGFAAPRPRRRYLPDPEEPETFSPAFLDGMKVHVLGPSRSEDVIRDLDPPAGASYLAMASPDEPTSDLCPFDDDHHLDAVVVNGRVEPAREVDHAPGMREWETFHRAWTLREKEDVERLRALGDSDALLAAAALTKAVNGTSLVLVFELGDACLLFPGDAQWGTWKAVLAQPRWQELLARTALLKVGHHGSHNATPPELVEVHLPLDGFHAMCSTKPDMKTKTGVWDIPREPLLDAVAARSGVPVIRSDLAGSPDPTVVRRHPQNLWVEVDVPTSRGGRMPDALDGDRPGDGTPGAEASEVATTKSRKKKAAKAKKRRPATALGLAAADDPTVENLQKIEHIVVLMLENRSFDQMLGYLSLKEGRTDVDGLKAGMFNLDSKGTPKIIGMMKRYDFEPDPCHGGECVDQQVLNKSGGFVTDFERHGDAKDPGRIMGYFERQHVPVHGFLAEQFAICDRWFSSVPGQTFPNRLFALTGKALSRDNRTPPVYAEASFVRHLDAASVSWGWYAHDFNTLRLIDGQYRLARKNMHPFADFAAHLAGKNGAKLPQVSWIDPNFYLLSTKNANDDHPPTDIREGQRLVRDIYKALSESKYWSKTLLAVVYDEHGGFYDHVTPGLAPGGVAGFRRYGVRVPAFVVSPFCEAGAVSHSVFDHTSLIKTILLRFCRGPKGGIPSQGPRVRHANHLGELLTRSTPRPAPKLPANLALKTTKGLALGAGKKRTKLTNLQRQLAAAQEELERLGFDPAEGP